MSKSLIKVEGVSKKFCKSLKKSLWYGIKDISSEVLGHRHESNDKLRPDEFWAVKDISFELKRGECLSLIGHNGAGKSTLLTILNGLIKPDQGKVTMHGRIGALIELGAGFNPILTGRENIYINGQVLGFTKEEIDQRIDDIIDFAEIGDFIDTPVQNYSSGMRVRLGFSVAAQMEPDILILDEVLAVGDIGFQTKCLNRIYELLQRCAVVFVTHAMPHVSRISTHALLMKSGCSIAQSSNVSYVIDQYHQQFESGETKAIGAGGVDFKNIEIIGHLPGATAEIPLGGKLSIKIDMKVQVTCPRLRIKMFAWTIDQRPVVDFTDQDYSSFVVDNNNPEISVIADIETMSLAPGKYTMLVAVIDDETEFQFCRVNNATPFVMKHKHLTDGQVMHPTKWSRLSH